MVIANVSIILFNYHQHWHTHHDIRDDGYDDLDDYSDCFDANVSRYLLNYHYVIRAMILVMIMMVI